MIPNENSMTFKKDIVIQSFSSPKEWNDWLSGNFDSNHDGIWLRIYKKNSGVKTITYEEALDEALCFGWIDSLKKSYDESSWIQKFTPRRAKSIWSKRNREKVEILIKEKRMQSNGLKEVEAAKKDGYWDYVNWIITEKLAQKNPHFPRFYSVKNKMILGNNF